MYPGGFNINSRLRASDADRDRAASVLNEAMAQGRLTAGPDASALRITGTCVFGGVEVKRKPRG